MARMNRLTNAQIFKLTTYVAQNFVDEKNERTTKPDPQIAEAATATLGFFVTPPNILSARKTLDVSGVNDGPSGPAGKRVAALEALIAEHETRITALEAIIADLNG